MTAASPSKVLVLKLPIIVRRTMRNNKYGKMRGLEPPFNAMSIYIEFQGILRVQHSFEGLTEGQN